MVQRQDHRVVVDDVKRMAQLAGVADAGHLSQVVAMRFRKSTS